MLLKGTLGVTEFVNPDVIAQGLSAFAPERNAMAAGRIMLGQLRDLVRRRETFAFETTLATRSFAPWLSGLRRKGYRVHLLFLWLASPDLAVRRVRKSSETSSACTNITLQRGVCTTTPQHLLRA